MVEYAIISGKNFLNLLEPNFIQLKNLYAKIGLNLTIGEACFVSGIIFATVLGLLILLVTK